MQLHRGEGGAVYAVLAYPSPHHEYPVAYLRRFFVRLFPPDFRWHYSACAAVDQRLPKIARVEIQRAVHCRYAACVPSHCNSCAHPFEHAAGMKKPGRDFARVIRVCKAEHIGVEDWLCPKSAAQYVAVHPEYSGERTAIRVKC